MNFNLKLTEHVNGSYGELNDESNNITGAGELVDSLLGHVHVGGLELVRVDGEVLHIPLGPSLNYLILGNTELWMRKV